MRHTVPYDISLLNSTTSRSVLRALDLHILQALAGIQQFGLLLVWLVADSVAIKYLGSVMFPL